MSAEKRSQLMGRIRSKDTGPERIVAAMLRVHRFKFEQHARDLPGRPDFVFRSRHLVILVDGDFWHGWRFPAWQHKLAPFWREKIAANRARDLRNIRRLRRSGWIVVRVWEHQLRRSVPAVRERLLDALRASAPGRARTARPC
ncbi:very short patch repair endonuclease [Rubrivivax gelatinosus]|uniref:very short patch repair endonuclease n=1 Tax=Rubrivivax gelatinosus TaxID=28068 RepID=UPI0034DAE907